MQVNDPKMKLLMELFFELSLEDQIKLIEAEIERRGELPITKALLEHLKTRTTSLKPNNA